MHWPLLTLHLRQFTLLGMEPTSSWHPGLPRPVPQAQRDRSPGLGGSAASHPSGSGVQGPAYALPSSPHNTSSGSGSLSRIRTDDTHRLRALTVAAAAAAAGTRAVVVVGTEGTP